MKSSALHKPRLGAGLAASMMLFISGIAGGAVEAIDQARSVHAFVIVPPCQESVLDDLEAEDFGPFDSTAEAISACAMATGQAVAVQQSIILDATFEAHGATSSLAESAVSSVLHAISSSSYSVTFEVTAPSRYALNAGLNAAGALPVVHSNAMVRLNALDGAIVIQESTMPGPDGKPNGRILDLAGNLDAGVYTFVAIASTIIDAELPPNGNGSASFDAILSVTALADLNADGAVNAVDLLILIGDWGPCADPRNCVSDLNGDGTVDILDLLSLLQSWS